MRALTPFDAPWLAELHGEGFDDPWSAQGFADLLNSTSVMGWCDQRQRGPGFILVQQAGDQAEILTFQVAKSARGQGLGRALLTHAITALRNCDVARIF